MTPKYIHGMFGVLFIVLPIFASLSDGKSIKDIKPSCYIRGWPPRMLLLGYVPSQNKNGDVIFNGHYCYPNKTSEWCLRPTIGYRSINCTHKVTDGIDVMCNMTEIIYKLYPSLNNPSVSNTVSYKLCMRISSRNKTNTSYSKFKCCNIQTSAKFSAIEDLRVTTPAKGQFNITWKSPSDIDNLVKGSVKFMFFLTRVDSKTNKTITVFPSLPRSPVFFYIIRDLLPYTRYSLTGQAFIIRGDKADLCKAVEALTLPEAPSASPQIIDIPAIVSKNASYRSVTVKWMHPAKEKRNGLIVQTIMEFQRQSNQINATLPNQYIIKGNKTTATIKGLDRDTDYILTLRSCTSLVDCSNHSPPVTMQGAGPNSERSAAGFKISSSALIATLVILPIVLSTGTIVCVVYWLRRRKERDAGNESSMDLPPDITIIEKDVLVLPAEDRDGNPEHIYMEAKL